MLAVLIGCMGNAFACPYKDAMALLSGDKNSNYARSLRGLFGIETNTDSHPEVSDEEAERRRRPPNNNPPPRPPNNNPPPNNQNPAAAPTFAPSSASGQSTPSAPYCIKTNGELPYSDETTMCISYQSIRAAVIAALPNNNNELANFFGKALRLAFHDAGN